MNDDELDRLLRAAQQNVELPPSFQRDVWRSIAADTARRDARWGWLYAMLGWLARPLPAATAWSLALFAGLVLGWATPPSPSTSVNVVAYAQFIDPLAKSASE
jgi:hypothetical protein